MKVFKLTLLFVDHDNLGDERTIELFNHLHLPNHIIGPTVIKSERVEISHEKYDDTLNTTDSDQLDQEFRKLFPEKVSQACAAGPLICDECGRQSVAAAYGDRCGMPQPDRSTCPGRFCGEF